MKRNYENNGYHIEKNVISKDIHKEIFYSYYDLGLSTIRRNKINLNFKAKKIEDLFYPEDIKILDKLLLTIFKFNPNLIGEIYDTVSYSSTFLKLISNKKIESLTRELLDLKKYNTLYSVTHRIRIDPPKDERRTYGWHQEIFYTIPNTKFLQTWAPILRDTTAKNGTIEICPGSHKEGIAKAEWKEAKGKATQVLVDKNLVKKYKKTRLSMKVGDILFFDPHLFHKSGQNSTKDEIRFSLVGHWNDCSFRGFRAPLPFFKSRTIGAKENFDSFIAKNKKK